MGGLGVSITRTISNVKGQRDRPGGGRDGSPLAVPSGGHEISPMAVNHGWEKVRVLMGNVHLQIGGVG